MLSSPAEHESARGRCGDVLANPAELGEAEALDIIQRKVLLLLTWTWL